MVWHMAAFPGFQQFWYFGVDTGEEIQQLGLNEVKVIDGNLLNFVFLKDDDLDPRPLLLHRVLAEDFELYKRLVERSGSAYKEFHRRRSALVGEV